MILYHQKDWAQSSLGHSIELFSNHEITLLPRLKPIVMIGGVHGDEPEGVFLATSVLEWLHKIQPDTEKVTPFVLIPCLNVDGYKINQRTNANGVDLNRNYPSAGWKRSSKKDRYYSGPSPCSESETQALVELVKQIQPQAIIHFHSWKPCVVLSGPANLIIARQLAESSGYPLVDNIGYPTPGSLSEYGWHDRKIPIICVEEVEKNPDKTAIWKRWEKGFQSILLNS